MKSWSDTELLDSLRAGDKEALSELFLRHYDYLLHYGLQICQDQTEVEECIQDLFIYLFEAISRLGPIHHVRAYLFKSLRRRVLEKTKSSRKREGELNNLLSRIEVHFVPEYLNEAVIRDDQLQEKLLTALNGLPWRQREAIYLRYYNSLKTKEIAEIMGVANQTILNTLYQALQNLRRQINTRDVIGGILLYTGLI